MKCSQAREHLKQKGIVDLPDCCEGCHNPEVGDDFDCANGYRPCCVLSCLCWKNDIDPDEEMKEGLK